MKIKLFLISIIALLPTGVAKAALVPCGPGYPEPDDTCKLCHLFRLLDNIMDFIFVDIIPPIALLAIIAGGVYYFISAGDPAKTTKAKGILTSVVMGLIIIYGAYMLINGFLAAIGIAEGEFGTNIKDWFEYPCDP